MAKDHPYFIDFDSAKAAEEALAKRKVRIARSGFYDSFVLRVRGDVYRVLEFDPANLAEHDECTFILTSIWRER